MKKLLTIFLCLVLSLGMALAVGCNEDTTFNGSYEEVTKEQALEFVQKVADSTGKGKLTDNITVEGSYEADYGEEGSGKQEVTLTKKLVEGQLQLVAKSEASGEQLNPETGEMEDISSVTDVYIKDGKSYLNDGENKTLLEDGGAMAKNMTQRYWSINTLSDNLIESVVDEFTDVTFSIDEEEGANKFKIVASLSEEAEGMSYSYEIEFVYVFDADYNLVSCKHTESELESIEEEGVTYKSSSTETMIIKQYDGEVEYPDLTDYTTAA